MLSRAKFPKTKRWVIKIGSALLTDQAKGLNQAGVAEWARQASQLIREGKEIVLVSSGSIAEGMARLGWRDRPDTISELQAAAAVGQMGLIQSYESAFKRYGIHTAQVLLTHDDLSDRKRYLNARATIRTLLKHGVVPIINENDTVITDEIRFGDNDTIAALAANLVEAELLVILTVQKGLYQRDPQIDPKAKIVHEAKAGDPQLDRMASVGMTKVGRGGMKTKLRAATLAARSGTATVIAGGEEKDVLLRIGAGAQEGTFLSPTLERYDARKQWLAAHLQMKGTLMIDSGAVCALKISNKSLLPIGVTQISGRFKRGEMVAILDPNGQEVARGLVNYNDFEAKQIVGKPSQAIAETLGYPGEEELIHRDNLVLI